jgi:integrase
MRYLPLVDADAAVDASRNVLRRRDVVNRVGFANSGGLVFVDESAEGIASVEVGKRSQRRRVALSAVFDAAGRRRSPATMPGYHAGRAPRNKGQLYPADPPTVEEIIAVMRQTPDDRHGARLRALIVVLWRGGLRIQEALPLIVICQCAVARRVVAP